jgi:hypothetical protein
MRVILTDGLRQTGAFFYRRLIFADLEEFPESRENADPMLLD